MFLLRGHCLEVIYGVHVCPLFVFLLFLCSRWFVFVGSIVVWVLGCVLFIDGGIYDGCLSPVFVCVLSFFFANMFVYVC